MAKRVTKSISSSQNISRGGNNGVPTVTVTNNKSINTNVSSTKLVKEFSLAGLIVFILIIVSVIGIMSGRGDQRTFYSFLEMLSNVPVVEFGFNTKLLKFAVDWPTWLNWAEVILKVLVRFVGLLAFFVQGLVNSLLYVYYFLRWVFVV